MEKILEIKLENLVFEANGRVLNSLIEAVRKDLGLTIAKFDELLQSEKGQKMYEIYDQVIADFLATTYTKTKFLSQLSIVRRNEKEIIKENQALFQTYFGYVDAVHIVYTNLIDAVFKGKKRYNLDIKDLVNISMYGNLCRKADEIGTLLRNGYPDAALLLWRAFYEHGVVACFLMKHDSSKLSVQFADAGNRDVYKKAASFNQRALDLKFRRINKKIIDEINSEFDSLKSKYPKEFFSNDYGWAFGFVEGKINLRSLEEVTDFSRFRPFYIWASEKSHPNFHGITAYRNSKKLVVPQKIIRPEFEKEAMVDPAQLTLSVFDQVNEYFIEKYSVDYEIDTNFTILRKLYEKFSSTL
jgi:hypothetical protein